MKEVMEGTCIRLLGTKIAYPESGKTINLPTVSTATATAADEPSDAGDNEHGGSDHRNELTPEVKTCLEEERANREDSEKDQLTQKKQEHDSSPMADSDGNPKNPMDEDTSKTETEEHKALKKPDKILPCPRCNSMDTKFCYYNNYNVNQPRHFCKSCQRYWTAGGNMRSMPVGAGRRKNKNPVSHCRFLTIPQEAFQAARIEAATASNGVHSVHPQILSFGPDSTHVDKAHISAVSCRGRENTDDCSSGSTVTTSNSVTENMLDRNGFHSHVPCIPGVSWSYNPWNSATPIPVSMPIYPSTYWNYIPWLPQLSHIQSQNNQSSSFILGKHSRDGELINPNGCEESKKQKNSVLIPKILRIDDPDEAAKSSIWATLGIKNENVNRGGVFKAFQTKSDENKKHPASTTSPVLQANPAALSRSLYFQERA